MTSERSSATERIQTLSPSRTELLHRLLSEASREKLRIQPQPRRLIEGESYAPVSLAQQRMWFIDQLEGPGAAYYISLPIRMSGSLDRNGLREALNTLVSRHEALRTTLANVDGEPMQKIAREGHFPLIEIDLSGLETTESETQLRQYKLEEAESRFDLSAGPLARGRLLRLGPDDHLLLITLHHIISDGWSTGVLLRELSEFYNAYVEDRPTSLSPLAIQYADYAQWQRNGLQDQASEKELAYWTAWLRGCPTLIELPTDMPRPSRPSYRGENIQLLLDADLTTRLEGLAHRQGLTLFMVLLAGWSLLLSRLTGQSDLVVGTPIANRQRKEVEGLIGLFINSLALRVPVDSEWSLARFLEKVKDITLEAYAHQNAPFERVVEAVRPERSLNYNPLFQTMLAFQNAPESDSRFTGISVRMEHNVGDPAVVDLLLTLEKRGDTLAGYINFATDLFLKESVERWLRCFRSILERMPDSDWQRIGDMPVLQGEEAYTVIHTFNATRTDFPRDRRLHEVFEEQAERSPDAIALIDHNEWVTYRELNALANRLARYLISLGVRPEERIIVMMHRSLTHVAAQLAIFKSGCTYVPIDPAIPNERLQYIISDCNARVIFVQHGHQREHLSAINSIDCVSQKGVIDAFPPTNLQEAMTPVQSPAYLMYTSGSTGEPKGVLVPHSAVVRVAINNGYAGFGPQDRVSHCSNPVFDAVMLEIWGALLNGASILVVPEETLLDPARTAEWVERHAVTIQFLPMGLLSQYADVLAPTFRKLRYLIAGGDIADPGLVRRIFRVGGPQGFLNAYGPTESTCLSTAYLATGVDETAIRLSIGKPIANTTIYILDHHLQPVPIGVTGEIYIGGEGVALGYLNRAQLTSARFLADPFSTVPGVRMYRSGDLGRWRQDGNVDFLGRNDFQVKIRGFRIELGEIEATIGSHPDVKEAVVVARKSASGEKTLVAYVVLKPSSLLKVDSLPATLRQCLKQRLPEYMVPATFIPLEALPLTTNGKVDRRALPVPDTFRAVSDEYEAPQGDIELALANVWQFLLGREKVGRRDNFFELGGHSLLIVRMLEQLRRLGLSVEVRRVFENPTLLDLAAVLTDRAATEVKVPPNLIPADCTDITPSMLPLISLDADHIGQIARSVPGGIANIQDIYPLAPLQEGILFHHLLEERSGDAYVIPMLLSFSSHSRMLEFCKALQRTIDRHDALRTAVLWERLPEPVQIVYRKAVLPVQEIFADAGAQALEFLQSLMDPEKLRMDLRAAPLVRVFFVAEADSQNVHLLLQIHHLVCDGRSLDTMLAEVLRLFEGGSQTLGPAIPYRNHVAQSLAYSQTKDSDGFFRRKLGDVTEPSLPFGLTNVHRNGHGNLESEQNLDMTLARRLRAQSRRLSVSPATLFHAAWAMVVAGTSGRDEVVYGTVLLGRLQGSAGGQRVLGMFINTLPLKISLVGANAAELVQRTHSELVELMEHEQASLASAQRCSGVSAPAPLFGALLNYRHAAEDLTINLDGSNGVKLLASRSWTNYPITVSVDDMGEGFTLTASTDRRIEPQRVVGYLSTAIESLVGALESDSNRGSISLPIIPSTEECAIKQLSGGTRADYSSHCLVHELFEDQVCRTPCAAAVSYQDQVLTYEILNQAANQLARHLLSLGITAGDPIGIYINRGLEMAISLLGILKAGAAYLPIDPSYPPDRVKYMIADASPRVILTQRVLKATLPASQAVVLALDELLAQISESPGANVPSSTLGLDARQNVYLIYTSGSTGLPKSTAMPHQSMVNLIEWHRSHLKRRDAQRTLQFAALGFDVAFQEIFTTLCMGDTLVIPDELVRRDAPALVALLRQESVQRMFLPPLVLQNIAEFCIQTGIIPRNLRDVITAGEQLRISAEITEFFTRLEGCQLHNHYGPTETHVVTALTLSGEPQRWPTLPSIGRPISNAQVYILDERRQLAPRGVIGEVYIAGTGMARGYQDRPGLTAERFVCDPFCRDVGARMYRSGDLGRWSSDGTIEYLGRNDQQVKLRGYRVELEEIESRLLGIAGIREAVVLAREDAPGDKRLVAYIVLDDRVPTVEQLRQQLQRILPEYMVPSAFVAMDRLPLTPNGKLDRCALPAPEKGLYRSREYQEPQGELEQSLAQLWQEILNVTRVGRDDNFFELGGHSLHAMRLASKVSQRLKTRLSVASMFRHPELHQMAESVRDSRLPGHELHPSELRFEEGVL